MEQKKGVWSHETWLKMIEELCTKLGAVEGPQKTGTCSIILNKRRKS